MAPEYPPKLVIFDARFDNGTLKGTTEYVETQEDKQRLRVRWDVQSQPEGFRSIGDGVAYVYDRDPKPIILPISKDALPMFISPNR